MSSTENRLITCGVHDSCGSWCHSEDPERFPYSSPGVQATGGNNNLWDRMGTAAVTRDLVTHSSLHGDCQGQKELNPKPVCSSGLCDCYLRKPVLWSSPAVLSPGKEED